MAIFTVNNSNDSGAGSLREALLTANANPGLDTIEIEVTNIELQEALAITDSVDIFGNGVVITQTGSDRLFTINDETEAEISVTLDNLKLTGGRPKATGGAVLSYEALTITQAEIYGNATSLRGGGIYSEGSLTVKDSHIHSNAIAEDPQTSAGGGIYTKNGGTLELSNTLIEANTAIIGGGVIVADDTQAEINDVQFLNNEGGAIFSSFGNLEVANSSFNGNFSPMVAGGITLEDSSAKIDNSEFISNSGNFGGAISVLASSLSLTGSTLTGNDAYEDGGAIDAAEFSTVEIANSTISGNTAYYTNGISAYDLTSTITVSDSVVEDAVEANVEFITSQADNAATPLLDLVEINRFYQYLEGHHFYTADENESNHIQSQSDAGNLSYSYEGESFAALATNLDRTTGEVIEAAKEVYRFRNDDTGAHLFTMDVNEKDYILENLDNYALEGTAFYAFETAPEDIATVPVYRMYNGDTGTHLFTSDSNEFDYIQENLAHFSVEAANGVAFYAVEAAIQQPKPKDPHSRLLCECGSNFFNAR